MALLVQAEALIMFWADYGVLWWIVLFLLVVDVVLIRMGIRLFNREALLGQEIDELNFAFMWSTFRKHLRWGDWFSGLAPEAPLWLRWLKVIGGLYGRDIPAILRRSRLAIGVVVIGFTLAERYPLPPQILQLDQVSEESFTDLPSMDWFPSFTPWGVLTQNVRSLLAAALLAVFSFGTLAITLLMAPLAIIFFFVAQVARLGYNPLLFFAAFVLPHGLLELPAASIATALAVRMGAAFMSPAQGMTVGEGWLRAVADFIKVFVALILPLLALAAVVEIYVTPKVVIRAFGG
jgi:uncharacterized membrane protein SpoIIM required for sporulation